MFFLNIMFALDNEGKEKPGNENGEEEVDAVQSADDSQFFNLGSKALKKLNNRKSYCIDNKEKKTFKSPQSKMPLQILVSCPSYTFIILLHNIFWS